jgi:CHAD domain-containing protein
MHELEVKLDVDPGWELPELAGEFLEPRLITSTYYDTAARTLALAGVTVRRRVENGRSLWQLKVPRGKSRLELEAPGGPKGPPKAFSQLLLGLTRRRPLEESATLRTRRTGTRVNADGAGVADVLLDSVDVLDGRRVRESFAEVEIELQRGDERILDKLGRRLRRLGARPGAGKPKLFRVLGLDSEPTSPPADATPAEHLRSLVARQYAAILAHDPGTRLGDDPEDLHQLRVATRRLRAILRAAQPLLEETWTESLRGELEWLGDLLGPVRDLDVIVGQLKGERDTLDPPERADATRLLDLLVVDRERARSELLSGLRSKRYLALLDTIEAAAAGLPLVAADETLEDIAGREFRKLRKAMDALPVEPSDGELHRARVKAKRARYAAELAAASAGRKTERFVSRAKRFQDVVGEHQDAVVAEERLRALLAERARGARTAFAAGRLVERQRARRRAAREDLPEAWQKLERAGRRAFS